MEPEQNTQTPENTFPAATPEAGNKNVFLIAGIAVIAILSLLGWYMLQSVKATPTTSATPEQAQAVDQTSVEASTTNTQTATGTEDAATAALSTQGTSDDLNSIQADLNATDLNSLNDINKI